MKAVTAPDGSPAAGEGKPRRRWPRLPTGRGLRDELRRNPELKLISLFLATVIWFTINLTERDAERLVELPVSLRRLQSGLIVTNPPTKPVAMTLRGPRTILDGVDERKARLAIDLGDAGPGETRVELNTDMLRPELPRRLKLVRLEPARLKIRVDRLARRMLPVRAELAGVPALGYTVAESRVVPDHVEVSGPATKLDDLKEITTEPIELRGMKDSGERTVLLAWAGDFMTISPDHVAVTVTMEEVMVSREFHHVEVRVVHDRAVRAQLVPSTIDLTVRGPQRLLHNLKLDDGAVYVDVSGLAPGVHRLGARVDLPGPLEVVRRQPEMFQVQIAGGGGR